MTSMIDVIFLLLIFFVMTFKIVEPEGDFNIKMPPAGAAEQSVELPPEPIKVKMLCGTDGVLTGIKLNDTPLPGGFPELRKRVLAMVQQRGGPQTAETEVELAPDDRLRYEYIIEAITAVSGEVVDNQISKICDKIKFASRPKK